MKTDPIDTAILKALQEDGRLSYRELARKLSIATGTVSAHLEHLEHLGIIRGYRAILNPVLLGSHSTVFLLRCRPASVPAVTGSLSPLPWVRTLLTLSGGRILVIASAPDAAAIHEARRHISTVADVEGAEEYPVIDFAKEGPLAVVSEGARLAIPCADCGGPLGEKPVVLRINGREHHLCCRTCAGHYRERYRRLREGAGPPR